MRVLSLAILPLVGCAPATTPTSSVATTLNTPVRPPPPFQMSLRSTAITPGAAITLTADGANPGDRVWFIRGTNVGNGPCLPALNGLCLDVVRPQPMQAAFADSTGRATLTITAPTTLPIGATGAFQAIQASAPYASQPLAVVAGQPSRQPGPLFSEVGQITAWEIQPSSKTTSYSPQCTDTTGSWAGVVGGPSFPATGFSYVFYELQSSLIQAIGQDCTAGFPGGCVPTAANWTVFGHLLEWVDTVDGAVTASCDLEVNIINRLRDQGEQGEWEIEMQVDYLGQCDPTVTVNDGCVATHRFQLDFAAP